MPYWLCDDISTIFLQQHDTSSSAPCERDWYPRTSISTQHVPLRKVMGVLKKCIRNWARPEGSITSDYRTEEVIDFCVDFIDDLKPIGVPESWYEGRLSGKGTLGKKSHVCTDDDSFKKAHYAVLQQSSLVDPYIEKHKKIVTSEFPEKSETWITRQQIDTFGSWLRRHLMHNMDIGEQLFLLSRGPSWNILTYQGYEINGNTFYTAAQDKKKHKSK